MPRKPRIEYGGAVYHVISRGNCRGAIVRDDADFRDRMLALVGSVLEGKAKADYDGAAVREHNERQAGALIQRALDKLGLRPEELAGLRKSDARKQAIAWLVRGQTSVSNQWVSDRLKMGHEVNVSQSVRRVTEAARGELR